MTTFSFLDDYSEGAHPAILRALTDSNFAQHGPYGDDAFSAQAAQRIRAHLGAQFDGAIHFVPTGTMANLVSIASCLRPHEAVIAVASGHIVGKETGAIEATGHKIIVVPPVNGKLTPQNIETALAGNAHFPHMARPRLLYVSNATETGTVYTLAELQAISALAKQRGLILFIDGARLGAALASSKNDATLADIAALADIFWIGGTKLGALLGEAIVARLCISHQATRRLAGQGAVAGHSVSAIVWRRPVVLLTGAPRQCDGREIGLGDHGAGLHPLVRNRDQSAAPHPAELRHLRVAKAIRVLRLGEIGGRAFRDSTGDLVGHGRTPGRRVFGSAYTRSLICLEA